MIFPTEITIATNFYLYLLFKKRNVERGPADVRQPRFSCGKMSDRLFTFLSSFFFAIVNYIAPFLLPLSVYCHSTSFSLLDSSAWPFSHQPSAYPPCCCFCLQSVNKTLEGVIPTCKHGEREREMLTLGRQLYLVALQNDEGRDGNYLVE